MSNILVLYNNDIESDVVLIKSFKPNCILRHVEDLTVDELLTTIDKTAIYKIALVYHNTGNLKIPFYDMAYTTYNFFSDDLIKLFTNFGEGLIVDILTCNLNNQEFTSEVNKIENELKINIRYSINQTGNEPQNDWILESDNINIKDIYFTEEINNWKGNLYMYTNIGVYASNKLIKDISGNVIWLHKDISGHNINQSYNSNSVQINSYKGTVVTWGNSLYGGNTPNNLSNVSSIYSTIRAFAALKTDGSVVAWGDQNDGGNTPNNLSTNIAAIYSHRRGFVGLTYNDDVTLSWGTHVYDGSVASQHITSVKEIYSNSMSFAALKNNGIVRCWGGGASSSSFDVSNLNDIVTIYSTYYAFAALKQDGSVVTWGESYSGGNYTDISYGIKSGDLSSNVVTIYSNYSAFAALKQDGSVVTWGNQTNGGYLSNNISDVVIIYSTESAFAALKKNSSVITWGKSSEGGSGPIDLSGVIVIYSTNTAFAALKSDGTVVAWGDASNGGIVPSGLSNVNAIYANHTAFAALKTDSSVIAWGNASNGGIAPSDLSGVVTIYSTGSAFAALKKDGTVVAWGDASNGGITPDISGVAIVYSNEHAFAALVNNRKPSAPIINHISYNNETLSIYFDQNNNNGYPAITQYRCTINNGITFIYRQINVIDSPWFITNLTNNTKYNIKISAYNANGWGPLSNEYSNILTDKRSNNLKQHISNNNNNNIVNTLLLDNNNLNDYDFEHNIRSLIYDISNNTTQSKRGTLISIAMKLSNNKKNHKKKINKQLEDLNINKNIPFDISDQNIVTQILDISSTFKNSNWIPSKLSVIIPDDNNLITIDLNNLDILLSISPDILYTVNAKYNNNNSTNSYNIQYYRTDISRYLIVDNINKYIGDSIIFNFSGNIIKTFVINILGTLGGESSSSSSGAGDPHIITILDESYDLPYNENCYLLFDNKDINDRVIITCKCWFLPEEIYQSSLFKNSLMKNTSFFKYINIYYKNENLTIDMETLNSVKYTSMTDVINYNLINNNEQYKNIFISELFDDTFVLKKYYKKIKILKYNVKFNGKSKIIKIGNKTEIKISVDLNCADCRNEILLLRGNFTNAIGALISQESAEIINYLIPLI